MSRLPPWQVRNNGERFRETVVAHHLWYNRCTEERQVESPGKHIVTCFCKIYAGVAQRQSSALVMRRLEVRFFSPAPNSGCISSEYTEDENHSPCNAAGVSQRPLVESCTAHFFYNMVKPVIDVYPTLRAVSLVG